ncbi:MAG: hypothetical protein WC668_04895 [Patescibacteria group bacterium]|jgi:hypothetical protein
MGRITLYRNIAIVFIICAAVVISAVFLLFYSQATIVITPEVQVVNLSFNTEIKTSSTPAEIAKQGAVGGTLSITNKTVEKMFEASSTKSQASNIVGQVKIVNQYSKSQQLVRTTQLQGENGVIVRTDEGVNIPAGGSVTVNVFPKDPAAFQPITSGNLTIIKLATVLQSKIFGQIISPLQQNAAGAVKVIGETDINRAKKELVAQAVAEAQASTTAGIVLGELVSYKIDKKLGDEASFFTMTGTVRLKTISADTGALAELIKDKAQKINFNDLSVEDIDQRLIQITVLDANNSENIAVKINYPLQGYLTADSPILEKSNFTGRTADEIMDYAQKTGVIKDIKVDISPSWRDITPDDAGRIKIVIK